MLQKYCLDCHSGASPEGKFSLDGVDPDLLNGPDLEAWRMIENQVRFSDMPPEDADHPAAAERAELLNWIRQESLKTQLPGVVSEEKLLLPQYGNYVDHLFLFGQRQPRVYPAYPRLWRLRPEIYDSLAPTLVSGTKVSGLANALNVLVGSEFKGYSAACFLDEASTQQLFANAKTIAEAQLSQQSRDHIFKKLASDDGPSSQEDLDNAIGTTFRKTLSRGPTPEEMKRFATFYEQASKTGGRKSAARALLMAVLLQPEFMFRQELGDGRPDAFGRIRLTPREVSAALSYALADEPLKIFLSAATTGTLSTNQQVADAVWEQLTSGSTPRLRQFFREFFHYPFATEVFKDRPEAGDHNPGMLVGDLEMTMWQIVRHDDFLTAVVAHVAGFVVHRRPR